jgi:hypothetical protein
MKDESGISRALVESGFIIILQINCKSIANQLEIKEINLDIQNPTETIITRRTLKLRKEAKPGATESPAPLPSVRRFLSRVAALALTPPATRPRW